MNFGNHILREIYVAFMDVRYAPRESLWIRLPPRGGHVGHKVGYLLSENVINEFAILKNP